MRRLAALLLLSSAALLTAQAAGGRRYQATPHINDFERAEHSLRTESEFGHPHVMRRRHQQRYMAIGSQLRAPVGSVGCLSAIREW